MSSPLKKYIKDTRRPIYSAALLLPFFVLYHAGTFFLKTTYVNGADALIVRLLAALSVHSVFASALVLLLCFTVWQLRSRASWKIEPVKVFALFIESLIFALVLFALFGWLSVHLSRPARAELAAHQKLILYCGAGIYEELVFRGFLLGLLVLAFTHISGWKKIPATISAALVAALLFSLFHYIGPASDPFTLSSFMQRTLGGLYFSAIFLTRGFGVTAASHALYDILVGISLL